MIPTIYGQTITVSYRGATFKHPDRYVATAVNPETRNYNWASVSRRPIQSPLEQITDAALAWLDKCQPEPWVIVGVAQNGTDSDSWQVFTVPQHMAYGLRDIAQGAVDAGHAMAAA